MSGVKTLLRVSIRSCANSSRNSPMGCIPAAENCALRLLKSPVASAAQSNFPLRTGQI